MSIATLAALLLAPAPGPAPAPAPAPERVFFCSLGAKRVEVTATGDTLTYRFGRPGKPEITLTGDPSGGVFFHRTRYVRGSDEALRFTSGPYDYIVFERWQGGTLLANDQVEPGSDATGLIIRKQGKPIRLLNCTRGGDFFEFPLFDRLKQDADNPIPDTVR